MAAPPAADTLDLVIGLPAHDGHSHEEGALHAVRAALAPQGGSVRWRAVVARAPVGDGGREPPQEPAAPAPDVVEVAFTTRPSDALNVPFHGVTARARALHAILTEAQARQARACIVVDPRAPVTADWIGALLQPLQEDAADFVAPLYNRHPYSGALVRGLLYPMFRALFGGRLRNPLGTDLACSRAMIDAVAADAVWDSDAGQIGIDYWLSATALSRGFRVAEAQLGDPTESRTGLDLSATIAQVLGVCFTDMERRASTWHRVRGSRPLRVYGPPPPAVAPPDVDPAALAESFRLGSRALQDVWSEVLPPLAMLQWRRLAQASPDQFRVDDGLWARTIYDFAMGHRLRVIAREHLLQSLAPLYLGWLASFVLQTRYLPREEADARIEQLCLVFEAEKPYLVSQWRWPERFKPVKVRR